MDYTWLEGIYLGLLGLAGISIAVISVVATEKSTEHRASIAISITGPCVVTDGEDSDEVRRLEGRS